jgi:hypothetical protein
LKKSWGINRLVIQRKVLYNKSGDNNGEVGMGVENVKAIFKKESRQPVPKVPISTITDLVCQKCGGVMVINERVEKKPLKVILGSFFIFFGLVIIISTAGVGLPVSIIVFVIAAMLIKSKKASIWKCNTCGYYFNRME